MFEDHYDYGSEWSDAENRIERAHDLYDHGQWQEALDELQNAIDINPNNSSWLFNKGLTLDTLERYYEAIEAFQTAHELEPHDPEILNCLGVDYTRVGQYDRALKTFEKLEATAPDFEPGYCNRIITYSELGRHEQAEEMFYLARQIKEDCPVCYYNMGNSLFSRQDYDRAIWCWQRTRQLDATHPQIEYRIGQAYWAKGERKMALEHFIAELRRHPGDIEVLLDAGIVLLELNQVDAAQEKFHRVLELVPHHAQALHHIGEILLYRGKTDEAVEAFLAALHNNPGQNGVNYRLGECYLLQGDTDNARRHLLAEMKFLPDNPDVLMDLGCLLEQVDQTTEALTCFERAIEQAIDNPYAYHNLSMCYYRWGFVEQGMDLSYKVLELDDRHVPALQNLAYAHTLEAQFDKAQQHIKQALDIEPDNETSQQLAKDIRKAALVAKVTQPLDHLWQNAAGWVQGFKRTRLGKE